MRSLVFSARLLIVVATMSSSVAIAQAPAPTTTTTSVEWLSFGPGACGAYTAAAETQVPYQDTAGADWTDLKIRMSLSHGTDQQGQPPAIPTVSVAINGVPIGNAVTVPNRGFCWSDPNLPLQTYEFDTQSVPAGYRPYGTNTFSVYVSGGFAGGPPAQLTFTTPPATFEFTYSQNQPDVKMLIHKYRDDDGYLSPFQIPTTTAQQPRVSIRGVVKVNGAGASRTVWMRLIDPEDRSQYVGSPHPNDNRDRATPRLIGVSCASAPCSGGFGVPLAIRSDPSGVINLTIEGTDRYAGDNYQVEASLDPNFTCAGPNAQSACPKSAIVVAWKRVYVEKKSMFRRGAYIVRPVSSGDNFVRVSDSSQFAAGQTVQLIHAPRLSRIIDYSLPIPSVPTDFFYSETNIVDRVEPATSTDPARIVFQTPVGFPFGPDPTMAPPTFAFLQDAVGVVTGSLHADFFVTNPAYLKDVFNAAFADYADAPQSITAFPNQGLGLSESFMGLFASKWYENSERLAGTVVRNSSNHRLLIGAGQLLPDVNGGARLGRTIGAPNPSFVFVDRIERAVTEPIQPVRNLSATNVNGEVTTHELVHQWNVNPNATASGTTEGHCLQVDYGGSMACLMHAPFNDPLHNFEYGDGTVRLHYQTLQNGTIDSEYMTIRTAIEPMPPY